MSLVCCLATVSAAGAERGDEEQARKHYRVAQEALKNNDLTVAAEELTKAAELAPRNAMVLYYLAIVQSKQGDVQKGLSNVQQALALGLPKKEQEEAEALEAQLTYRAKTQISLDYFVGTWGSSRERGDADDDGPYLSGYEIVTVEDRESERSNLKVRMSNNTSHISNTGNELHIKFARECTLGRRGDNDFVLRCGPRENCDCEGDLCYRIDYCSRPSAGFEASIQAIPPRTFELRRKSGRKFYFHR
jgi:hypothetical protein